MESAQPFQSDDFPGANCIGCAQERLLAAAFPAAAGSVPKFQMRSASRAGIRLSMETAIGGILILGLALGTHHELFYRAVSTIVRERLNDGEARAAVGAIREGILVSPILWVEDLANAFGTGRDVRQDQRGFGS